MKETIIIRQKLSNKVEGVSLDFRALDNKDGGIISLHHYGNEWAAGWQKKENITTARNFILSTSEHEIVKSFGVRFDGCDYFHAELIKPALERCYDLLRSRAVIPLDGDYSFTEKLTSLKFTSSLVSKFNMIEGLRDLFPSGKYYGVNPTFFYCYFYELIRVIKSSLMMRISSSQIDQLLTHGNINKPDIKELQSIINFLLRSREGEGIALWIDSLKGNGGVSLALEAKNSKDNGKRAFIVIHKQNDGYFYQFSKDGCGDIIKIKFNNINLPDMIRFLLSGTENVLSSLWREWYK